MTRRWLVLMLCAAAAAQAADAWKVAPEAPASRDRDRLADLKARRKAVVERIGEKGAILLFAAEPRNYANDVDWPYRQENNFFYLTGIYQPGNALLLIGGNLSREILFLRPSNPRDETWNGHVLTQAEGREISGIAEIWDARHLPAMLSALLPRAQETFEGSPMVKPRADSTPLPNLPPLPSGRDLELYMMSKGNAAEYGREIQLAAKLAALSPPVTVNDATSMFAELRRVKSAREMELVQHAVDITTEAFERVFALATPGTWEYEIQAQFEFTFKRRNGQWGYPCIVASGSNATTLHYQTNQARLKAGELILLDNGAEFDGYSADITRTLPVSGKFTKEQAEIYRLVWEAQQAGIRSARPGRTLSGGADSVQGAANEVLKRGLLKLGLITDPENAAQLRVWTIHGIGHGIGLNVHDPLGKELQPDNVITVEPGVYIRPDALDFLPKNPENEKFIAAVRPAFEKYKGIGVRIEDDVLITSGKPKVLSSAIPSKLEDVEAAVARLRKALKSNPLP